MILCIRSMKNVLLTDLMCLNSTRSRRRLNDDKTIDTRPGFDNEPNMESDASTFYNP